MDTDGGRRSTWPTSSGASPRDPRRWSRRPSCTEATSSWGSASNEPLFEEWLVAERSGCGRWRWRPWRGCWPIRPRGRAPSARSRRRCGCSALDPLQEAVHRDAHAALRPSGPAGRGAQAIPGVRGSAAAGARDRARGRDEAALSGTAAAAGRGGEGGRSSSDRAPARAHGGAGATRSPGRRDTAVRAGGGTGAPAATAGRGQRGTGTSPPWSGEAGIGKTRLVTRSRRGAAAGLPGLIGRCHESDTILPFGPWVDACRSGAVDADEEILGALHPARRAELTRLLPEAGMAGLPPASDSALPLFESMAELSSRSPAAARWSSCWRTCTGPTR